ncbi:MULTISPECIES: toll/interleukin-1 receptor domain-containing protein [Polyangium]|uniref:Toll/interleukin-1 receptor domain-containing protein n=2 Tax=Polyangium TaxID=55 RepID=A0A4U1JF04_9BACT|nr:MULTISPECIES: toll/interleukin-1 receptor domain-containing protein [Polyangium]MDI1431507.1 toll/interleukin-1 receptor domain-containing protein [Polyangium sorediatum]TKD09757.1 toll/interleukin-1 receptor domain-containing protein [Polyangium fumosum]
MNAPLDIFISYSHTDEAYRVELEKHLSLLRRSGAIRSWHDRQIGAGDEWKRAIDGNLNQAAIILLLVSADFVASEYCYDIELKRAMERRAAGEAVVIPIILRQCDGWQNTPFGAVQALPRDGKPIKSWADPDEAWTDVARGIRRVVEKLRAP